MNHFDQWPIYPYAANCQVAGTPLKIPAYCLKVDVSLTVTGLPRCPANAPRFPAVIDTGHSHNFSIRETQLNALANVQIGQLTHLTKLKVTYASGDTHDISTFDAEIWLHARGQGRDPLRLEVDGGITGYCPSDGVPGPPYPLIGSRLLSTADVLLKIDYGSSVFSIDTPP